MEWEEEVTLSPVGHEAFKVRICELPMADGVHASTGCQLWSSSIVLARHLMARPHVVEKKKVLEVGAGCGLLGLAVARLAQSTLITDGDEEVVRNLSRNIDLNRSLWNSNGHDCLKNVTHRVLRWEELIENPWPKEDHVEVIVASDVIYGNWGETVAEALCKVLLPGGQVLLAASEDRRGGVRGFQDVMEDYGFGIEEIKIRVQPLGGFRIYHCSKDIQTSFLEREEELEVGCVSKLQEDLLSPEAGVIGYNGTSCSSKTWRVVGGSPCAGWSGQGRVCWSTEARCTCAGGRENSAEALVYQVRG